MKHLGTKTLETKRFILRKFNNNDYAGMFNNWASDPIVTKYVTWNAHKDETETEEYLKTVIALYERKDYYHWVIEEKKTKEVIGSIASVKNDDVCVEVGYSLSFKYWNKGVMTEALVRLLEFFFEEVGFEVALARHIKANRGSGEVMKKAGMKWMSDYVDNDGKELSLYEAKKDNYKENKLEYLLDKIHQNYVGKYVYHTFGYQKDYRKNEQVCNGYVPFVNSINLKFIESIIPDIYKTNRNMCVRESTEYIVVHDTASAAPSADGRAHNNWIHNMANDPENTNTVSWHFTVDDVSIYQQLPLNEIAHHAGDGLTEKMEFFDSGIDVEEKCEISISECGKYLINGKESLVNVPLDKEGNVPTNDMLPYNGVCYRIGDNRKYLIGKTWWSNSYQKIGNRGGNNNSIGMETCVHMGSNYINTMRNTAALVAGLMLKYDLDITRVKQHNDFSGKDCPMTMRRNNFYNYFMECVYTEYEILTKYSDIEISLKPLSKGLNVVGLIELENVENEVKYLITLRKDNECLEFEYTTQVQK